MAEPFNSDDIVFSDGPSKDFRPNIGQKSIDQIIEHAAEDRIESKRTVKQLKFGRGSPGHRMAQSLWVRRFETFREVTLGQDINSPFNGETLLRFFKSIIGKIKPGSSDKPAPCRSTIVSAVKTLIVYGHFKWSENDGYKIDRHATTRFYTWVDYAVTSGQLTNGVWKSRTWIGFTTLSRIVRAFLHRAITYGTTSWDITIAKCLSIVLAASLGARAGDIGLSRGYTSSQCMQYRHIELWIDGDRPIPANLRASVTIHFEKGSKNNNKERTLYLRPLNESHNCHVCPISLLLIHALRHGLLAGGDTTLQRALDRAWARSDHEVKWLYPNRPVLAAFTKGNEGRCDLDTPAGAHQLTCTIREMGIIAGVLGRVHSHALRYGAARDMAHLPPSAFEGITTESVRQSLGHTQHTMAGGVTETYVGGGSADIYNSRAENTPTRVHHREPRFAADSAIESPLTIVKKRVSENELQERAAKGVKRSTAIEQVRSERIKSLKDTVDSEPRGATTSLFDPSPLPMLAFSPDMSTAKPHLEQASYSPLGTSTGIRLPNAAHPDPAFLSNIDPALLDDQQIEDADVPQSDLDRLTETLMLDIPSGAEGNQIGRHTDQPLDQLSQADESSVLSAMGDGQEEATQTMLNDETSALDPTSTASPEQWITTYAKYNVVGRQQFAVMWSKYSMQEMSIEDAIASGVFDQHSTRGNSRDDPCPFVYKCKTSGCPHTSIAKPAMEYHEERCTEERAKTEVAAETYADELSCSYSGCTFTTLSPNSLKMHIKNDHDFEPKPCPEDGCDPDAIYYDYGSLYRHKVSCHSGKWPTKCPFPDCEHPTEFGSEFGLRNHLAKTHKVPNDTPSMQPYLPSVEKVVWVNGQPCVVEDCDKVPKGDKFEMRQHLMRKHKMTREDADSLMDEKGQTRAKPPNKHGGPRAPSKGKGKGKGKRKHAAMSATP